MAVVQISRIQVRRGKRNQGSGLPQLASGEFGWAVDTQELFIGNGSVSEGAPQVGNTRILTSKDNIFDYANSYTFRGKQEQDLVQTGIEASLPIVRDIQDRLDDRVSVESFGISGDSRVLYSYDNPSEDVSEQLQHAINQLYLSTVAKQSFTQPIELFIPAGHYSLTKTIYLPPNVSITGEDKEKTILHSTANPAFRTVDKTSYYSGNEMQFLFKGQPGYSGTTETQAKYLSIKKLTIDLNNPNADALYIDSCVRSDFSDLILTGNYSASSTTGSAIFIDMFNNVVSSAENKFENIEINNFYYAIFSKYDIKLNTFDNLHINDCEFGVVFGQGAQLGQTGELTGPLLNTIKNCVFTNVKKQGILIFNGIDNLSVENIFNEVGNDGGNDSAASSPIIDFRTTGNRSVNDTFSRSTSFADLNNPNFSATVYYPEIIGPGCHFKSQNFTTPIRFTDQGSLTAIKLPASADSKIKVSYVYQSSNNAAYRSGEMTLHIDKSNNQIDFVDDYNITGIDSATFDNLNFFTSISNNTLSIRYNNSSSNDTDAVLNYSFSYYY